MLKHRDKLAVSRHVEDLEAVRIFFKLEKLTLLGNSWGGLLLGYYAAAHPDRVERLILHSPGPPTIVTTGIKLPAMPESLTTAELLVPGIILGGAGLVFLALMLTAVAQWIKVAGARRWPVARGTVLESRVCESSDSDGGPFYRPVITYEYRVGRQVYTGDLLAFGLRSLSEGGVAGERKAHETVARYPVGGDVEVRYDPKRPARCVLEVRSAITKWLVIAGVIVLLMGTFVAAVILIGDVASH